MYQQWMDFTVRKLDLTKAKRKKTSQIPALSHEYWATSLNTRKGHWKI